MGQLRGDRQQEAAGCAADVNNEWLRRVLEHFGPVDLRRRLDEIWPVGVHMMANPFGHLFQWKDQPVSTMKKRPAKEHMKNTCADPVGRLLYLISSDRCLLSAGTRLQGIHSSRMPLMLTKYLSGLTKVDKTFTRVSRSCQIICRR